MTNAERYQFFEDLARKLGLTDIRFVKQYYYSLVKMISTGLSSVGKVKLPDVGEFVLKDYAEHMLRGKVIPASKSLKFNVDRKLKDYLRNYNKLK